MYFGLFATAVVTDNYQLSLFVLARDPAQFNVMYDAEVTKMLQAWNFSGFLNTPTKTVQDGCSY